MKLNNKGFALTSMIYMLIVLFLMIMLLILANLAQRKVVLDKIKNDVKNNLNQGGLVAQNIYIVTFDPTLGQIDQTSKQVKYNEPYGELPTPTREGYKFIGWTSKNLAPEINNQNYILYNFENRTTTEFREENGTNYIRINGNSSNENIDTMWQIRTNEKLRLNQGQYILSFDVRSQNALATQSIKKIQDSTNTIGRTGIYVNQSVPYVRTNVLSTIENDYIFDNDGQWHHFTSKVTIPYDTIDALIVIGNDAPNIYGENSYLDIKNIQLEPGDTATTYEPYQEYTSDTIVTKRENHTLYAMWEPLYMVTFDPDGGTLSETTKWVEYNEPYGSLPTPTREGYTFLGWRGKNLIDDNSIVSGYYIDQSGQEQPEPNGYYWSHSDYIGIEGSKIYTFSTDSASGTGAKHSVYDENKNFITAFDSGPTRMKMPANAKYIRLSFRTTSNNVQLYQEYTSDTIVTKRENHTLYAMWEASE